MFTEHFVCTSDFCIHQIFLYSAVVLPRWKQSCPPGSTFPWEVLHPGMFCTSHVCTSWADCCHAFSSLVRQSNSCDTELLKVENMETHNLIFCCWESAKNLFFQMQNMKNRHFCFYPFGTIWQNVCGFTCFYGISPFQCTIFSFRKIAC